MLLPLDETVDAMMATRRRETKTRLVIAGLWLKQICVSLHCNTFIAPPPQLIQSFRPSASRARCTHRYAHGWKTQCSFPPTAQLTGAVLAPPLTHRRWSEGVRTCSTCRRMWSLHVVCSTIQITVWKIPVQAVSVIPGSQTCDPRSLRSVKVLPSVGETSFWKGSHFISTFLHVFQTALIIWMTKEPD